jgi:hypothetical protein
MIEIDKGAIILPQQSGIIVTADVHNANPGVGAVAYVRQLVIGSSITGFSGGEENRLLILQPTRNSSEDVNLAHNSGSSLAANRLQNGFGATSVTSFWGSCAMYIYDDVEDLWKEVG